MKLATLRDGTRDGRLVVVSRDLTRCLDARAAAPTLQAALDAWGRVVPRLRLLAEEVEAAASGCRAFDEAEALSPLPRAYQ